MQEFIEHVERDPRSAVCPATADRIHCVLIGIPGIADAFERFCNAYQQVARRYALRPGTSSALTVAAWAHLWRGRRAEALAAHRRDEAPAASVRRRAARRSSGWASCRTLA